MVWNGFMVTPDTAIDGIESIWPGEVRVFDAEGAEERRDYYWQLPSGSNAGIGTESELSAALESCVEMHLASDVPLSVFLSGGVDSSAIACMAQRVAKSPINTFTLAFEEPEYDESAVARRVARALRTEHHEFILTEEDFIGRLDKALDSLDQPTFDGINSYYISSAIRAAGFKVALVGTGGDELFGGYTSFREIPTLLKCLRPLGLIPPAIRRTLANAVSVVMSNTGAGEFPPQVRWAKLPAMAEVKAQLLSHYQLAYALFTPDSQELLLGENVAGTLIDGLPPEMHARIATETHGRSLVSGIGVLEQRLFLGERLLRDTDAASMASSLEVRLPLTDSEIVSLVTRLPDKQRFHPLGSKLLLRKVALQSLDKALFERPKSGFVLPFDRWLRRNLGKVIDHTLAASDAIRQAGLQPTAVRRLWKAFQSGSPGLYWTRIWAVFVLVRWCQRHGAYL
jgi:asparagine synthase (glutamine-hydrolysing)